LSFITEDLLHDAIKQHQKKIVPYLRPVVSSSSNISSNSWRQPREMCQRRPA